MRISFHVHFEKKFKKLDSRIKKKFIAQLKLFAENPFLRQLNNHALKGSYKGYRSINVTGDYRAIYKHITEDGVEFQTIDTHGTLYA